MFNFQGWVGHVNLQDQRNYDYLATTLPDIFPDFSTIDWNLVAKNKAFGSSIESSDDSNRIDFCDFAKIVTGDYLKVAPQLLGDCVAASAQVSSEYLNLTEIALHKELQEFKRHYRPYLYGTGRVFEGRNQLGYGDGSIATWQVAAMAKYGILRDDLEGLPKYSKTVGKEWGYKASLLNPWIEKAKTFPVKKSIRVKNFEQLCKVMIEGKMTVVIASNQGFRMELKKDTKANKSWFIPSGTWGHQMSILAAEKTGNYPGARVHNQWGEAAHPGQLDGPDGSGWVSDKFIDRWLAQSSAICLAIGDFDAWVPDLSTSPF